MWRGIVMGLVAGVIVGWMLWGRAADVPTEDEAHAAGRPPAADLNHASPQRGPLLAPGGQWEGAARPPAFHMGDAVSEVLEQVVDGRELPADRSDLFRGGALPEMREAFSRHPRLSNRETSALLGRLEEARRERGTHTFLGVLRILGTSRHPLAQARFAELYADVDASLPEGFMEVAVEFLNENQAPGALEAALKRAHNEQVPLPWLSYVVRHGTPEQWEELLSSSNKRVFAPDVFAALMEKDLDTARGFLERAQTGPWLGGNRYKVFETFLSHHPDAGFDLLEAGFRAFAQGAEEWMGAGSGMLISTATSLTPASYWPRTAALLNGLESRQDRLSSYWTLRYKRGYDMRLVEPLISRLGPDLREVVDTPGVVLRPGERIRFLAQALDEVDVLRTPGNIAALEHAVSAWQGDDSAELKTILERIRAAAGAGAYGNAWR